MAGTEEPEPLDEARVQRKWIEMAPLIDRMMERTDQQDEFPVAAGSSLAADDRASSPFHLSHMLRLCITAGVDHLHASKTLVVDQQVVHLAAPSSLARGALETFAAAYWMLGPTSRTKRVENGLRWYAQNLRDSAKVAANVPPSVRPRDSLDIQLNRVCAVGAARGIPEKDIRAGCTSTAAVKYADENAPDLPLGVLLPWRISSGFAHGRPWAYLGVSERSTTVTKPDGTLSVRLTSDLGRALLPNLAALQLLEKLLRLYQNRASVHLAE
jgi:hypothetical protein